MRARCSRLLQTAMPIERFQVERALEVDGPSTDELLAEAVRIIAPLPVSVLRDELVKFTADRLGINVQLVGEVLRGAAPLRLAPRPWEGRQDGWGDRGGRQWNNGRGGQRGERAVTGTARRPRRPSPSTRAPRSPAATGSEEAYLAYCIALPEEGEQRLAAVEIEDYFSSPSTRKAAHYLREHLRHPGSNLPSGDEELARLVAKLTVDAQPPRSHPREARARGAAARPAPPRAPHLERPPDRDHRCQRPRRSSARGSSTRSAIASPEQDFSVRRTN